MAAADFQLSLDLTLDAAEIVCGVDEAGRGPLAGPVVAAAVILDPDRPIAGLADSKALTANKRDQLYELIRTQALAWHVAQASVAEIDELNILHATMLAMRRAVEGLAVAPTLALIDGNRCPTLKIAAQAIVKGDAKVAAISAASILAKVTRDRLMTEMDAQWPQYGFALHSGYPTPSHLEALGRFGPCPEHRTTFGPVRDALMRRGSAA